MSFEPGSGDHQLQIAAALLSHERARVTPGQWHDRIARSLARLGLLAEEAPGEYVRTAAGERAHQRAQAREAVRGE